MPSPALSPTLVFHRAALGDLILIWPFLTTLGPATLISDGEKARLTARFLPNITPAEIESARWNSLWNSDPGADLHAVHDHVTRVISFLAPPDSIWAHRVRTMFPGAHFRFLSTRPPIRLGDLSAPAVNPAQLNSPPGSAIFHLGSGGHAKRWPFTTSFDFVRRWRTHRPLTLVAGPVEHEHMLPSEREAFESLGGVLLPSLDALADAMLRANLFIGFDSGPTHLAAILGLQTFALFGPTDHRIWRPNGPHVHVLSPDSATTDMTWLVPHQLIQMVIGHLDSLDSSTIRP